MTLLAIEQRGAGVLRLEPRGAVLGEADDSSGLRKDRMWCSMHSEEQMNRGVGLERVHRFGGSWSSLVSLAPGDCI